MPDEFITDPWAYIAVVTVGLLVFGLRALIKGDLRTGREAMALERRAETAEAANRVRDEQVNAALAVLPKVLEVLQKIHRGGIEEQAQRERDGS